MSKMVVAKKYELQAQRVDGSQKSYDKQGQKKLIHGNKQMPLEWVEDRNSQSNNELYVIDEEATVELESLRAESIKNKETEKKNEKLTVSDLLSAINGDAPKEKRTRKPNIVK